MSIDDGYSYHLQGGAGRTIDYGIVVRLAQNGGDTGNKAMQLQGIKEELTPSEEHYTTVHVIDPSTSITKFKVGVITENSLHDDLCSLCIPKIFTGCYTST